MGLTISIIILAVITGLGVGYALQRGRGCTNTAFRNLLLIGNGELALMLVVVVCIELIGYYFLSIGIIGNIIFQSNPIPFSLLIPVGGFIFGLGTVFAGGCAGGTCYRIGEGSIASVLAFIGFAFGIAILAVGPLVGPVNELRTNTTWTVAGDIPTLEQIFPRWVWTIGAVILLIVTIMYYLNKQQNNELQLRHLIPGWNPITTGIVVGIFGILARYSSTLAGRDFGLSTTDGIGQIVQTMVLWEPIGWAGIFILALIIGSAVAAKLGNEFHISIPKREEIFRFFGGGILLGVGAMLGLGCNFGHVFGGIAELGISSFVALIFMMLGNGIASHLYYIYLNNDLPQSTPVSMDA